MLRRIVRSERFRALACWLGAWYIRLVWASGRWTIENAEAPERLWAEGKPFIMAFWHGHLLMMPEVWKRGVPMHMLISQHRDGLIIARIIGHFGLDTVAGSSSRGGAAALRQMLKALKAGECVGITPDGPRGPRMRATDGIVAIARLSGVPILPVAFSCRRRKQLRSWDRFQVALPFTRGVVRWGEPIVIGKGDDAAAVADLESRMIALAHGVEAAMDQPPTPPAEPGETRR